MHQRGILLLCRLRTIPKVRPIVGAPIRKNPAKLHCQGVVPAGFLQSQKREERLSYPCDRTIGGLLRGVNHDEFALRESVLA